MDMRNRNVNVDKAIATLVSSHSAAIDTRIVLQRRCDL